MADGFKKHRHGIHLEPQSGSPSNPVEGDVHFADGTARTEGIYRYDGAAWVLLAEGTVGALSVLTKTDNYTLTTSDDVILMNNTTNKTATLPTAAGNSGKEFIIVRIDSTAGITTTIDGDGSETIDGTTTINLDRQYQSVRIISNGTNWFVISGRHQLDSMVRLHTGNGHGGSSSGEDKVRNFTTAVTNVGTAITYTARTTTTGDKFTINEPGIYMICTGDSRAAGDTSVGISLNSSQLTTDVTSITAADRLAVSDSAGATFRQAVSWTGILAKDDVIRSHDKGNSDGGATTYFTITKIGRL